jgi:hypothetical protein
VGNFNITYLRGGTTHLSIVPFGVGLSKGGEGTVGCVRWIETTLLEEHDNTRYLGLGGDIHDDWHEWLGLLPQYLRG